MKSRQSPAPIFTQPRRAVIYARVSSQDQKNEGYSIPAQLKLLNGYATDNSFAVAHEYTDVETAKQAGRSAFGEMTRWLLSNADVKVILVEKIDRLYRNFRDYVTIDDLDAEVHFVKEGEILSKDSRSAKKFLHDIKVVMAKNYSDNLSEETRKGQREKAEQGIWPSFAPLGYQNVTSPDGRRRIIVDPVTAPIVAKMFEWYATGEYSTYRVSGMACREGLLGKKNGNPISPSSVRRILRNRIYAGSFDWVGKTYQGVHTPLVSVELWDKAQHVMDGKMSNKHRRGKHNLAYMKLMVCAACGSAITANVKKGKYRYYHCTGHRNRNPREIPSCRSKYVREEALEHQFATILGQLRMDDEVFEGMRDELLASQHDKRREQEEAGKRLSDQYDHIQRKLEVMYVDKLEGRIGNDFYDKLARQFQAEQDHCRREIERLRQSGRSYLEEGVQIIELAQNAYARLSTQDPGQKRQLLKFLLSNCTWEGGKVIAEFRNPLDLLAKMNAQISSLEENGAEFSKTALRGRSALTNFPGGYPSESEHPKTGPQPGA